MNVNYIIGPIATALANRFSVKSVTFVGGLLLAAGVMISAFAPNVEFLFLSIGVLAGTIKNYHKKMLYIRLFSKIHITLSTSKSSTSKSFPLF